MNIDMQRPARLLDPGMCLTLRPMIYPQFFEMYRAAIKNTWTVEEINFSTDVADLTKMTSAERHLIQRLVAFFATGDSIVANNLVLNLYKHVNAPEARMYLSRQLFEEALHVQFYLTLLDTYVPEHSERQKAFAAVETIPSIKQKADFCLRWIDSIQSLDRISTPRQRRQFLSNLICFAACIEGLFFFGAFAYVYFLRSKGLLPGLADGTNWVFRDESCMVDGTEVLTPKGWVDFRELTEDTQVAQFDLQTHEISFVKPLRVLHKPHRGSVRHLRHRKGGVDQMMTMDHDIVQRWDYQKQWSKQPASEFKINGKKKLPVAGHALQVAPELTDEQRFLIAFQADGHLSERYTGERCGTVPAKFSLRRDRKIARLTDLVTRLGWKYKVDCDENGWNEFFINVPASTPLSKHLNTWVDLTKIDTKWATDFVEELRHWDGHTPADPMDGYYIYYSSKFRDNVDVVQAVATLGGRHATFGIEEDHRSDTYSTMYRTWIHDVDIVSCGSILDDIVAYDGNVHCVTVPTGAFVMRYNNKVSITGNCHMTFAFAVVATVRREEPELFDAELERDVRQMIDEAIDCEAAFAEDLLAGGVAGLSVNDVVTYLQFVADQRLAALGYSKTFNVKNPFGFMDLQDVQEMTNFFERRASAYQQGVEGEVDLNADF